MNLFALSHMLTFVVFMTLGFPVSLLQASPLHDAVDDENFQQVQRLVESGAPVNDMDHWGATPLYRAVIDGNLKIMKYLIDHGADVNWKNLRGKTPLFFILGRNLKNVTYKRKKVFYKKHPHLKTHPPLPIIIQEELNQINRSIIGLLVKSGADPNLVKGKGRTVMDEVRDPQIAQLLHEFGARLDSQHEPFRYTPLMNHVIIKNMEIVRFLLTRGVQVNTKDGHQQTALHHAASSPSLDNVMLLMDNGSDVNAEDFEGWTPLFSATGANKWYASDEWMKKDHGTRLRIIQLLLNKGADINHRDLAGHTAVYHTAKRGHETITQFLLEHNADTTVVSKNGNTLLHAACKGGMLDLVRKLVKEGHSVNVANKARYTPLHFAKKSGNQKLVKYLMDQGAEVDRLPSR